jgi:hypothetical protein
MRSLPERAGQSTAESYPLKDLSRPLLHSGTESGGLGTPRAIQGTDQKNQTTVGMAGPNGCTERPIADTPFFDDPSSDALRPLDVAGASMFGLDRSRGVDPHEFTVVPTLLRT